MSFPSSSVPPPEEPQAPVEVSSLAVRRPEPALDAWSPAPPPPAEQAWRRSRRIGWELVQTLLLAFLIFVAVRSMAQNFRVEGSSMEPGLHDGQYLLVNKAVYFKLNFNTLSKYIPFVHGGNSPERFLFRPPHRGDVIVFRYPRDPTRDFIKRVMAVPGDTVEITNGSVLVNGKKVDESYIANPASYDLPSETVPNGNYFVLGDNRNNSFDSHVWGYVPEENIIGQAMLSYWPLHNFGGVGNRSLSIGPLTLSLP
jgi:signal peptidase I